MVRRIFSLAIVWLVLSVLVPTTSAGAQDGASDGSDEDEEVVEPAQYGDSELIETLRGYDLLDEWIAASPVSPEASLLWVSGAGYLAKRQTFLDSLEAWSLQTERLRTSLDRIDAARADVEELRAATASVRDALVLDDRLRGSASDTLVVIAAALAQIAEEETSEPALDPPDDPLGQAEQLLRDIRERAGAEFEALNSSSAAVNLSGVQAFGGFDLLQDDLQAADQLLDRSRNSLRSAEERSDLLVASTLDQIPGLHAARMLGSSDVDGLSIVTVDAYITGASSVACSVDWALLAGIGSIESKHGRLGGAAVSGSGQVSPPIFGPLLDGGATDVVEDQFDAVVRWWLHAIRARVGNPLIRGLRDLGAAAGATTSGNGFAVIVDSDGGRLDGNDEWDRAVGPMQFLPETWSRWARDGNGDGVADPHNLYDASATAARFLCDLIDRRGSSPSSFLRGYNDSASYARTVAATARELRAALLPTA